MYEVKFVKARQIFDSRGIPTIEAEASTGFGRFRASVPSGTSSGAREELEFIEKLGMDALFSTNSKLSRVDIMAALVDAAMALGISAEGVKNKKELAQRILDSVRSHPERREYPRLKRDLIVEFRRMDSMKNYHDSVVDDISAGGFKIEVAFGGRPLAINEVIEIAIRDPEQKDKVIKAIGRVAWIKQKEDKHGHDMGVMLTYIKEEDKEKFRQYLGDDADTEKPENHRRDRK